MQTTLRIFQVKNIPKDPFSQIAKPAGKKGLGLVLNIKISTITKHRSSTRRTTNFLVPRACPAQNIKAKKQPSSSTYYSYSLVMARQQAAGNLPLSLIAHLTNFRSTHRQVNFNDQGRVLRSQSWAKATRPIQRCVIVAAEENAKQQENQKLESGAGGSGTSEDRRAGQGG